MIPSTCPCCEVLQPPHEGDCTFHADAPGDAATFDEVSALRAEIARLREERRWVPVGERLPDDHRRVVVNVPSLYGPQLAWLVNGKWHDGIGCGDHPIGCRVTHWQPQPMPPGPEGDG